MWHQFYQNRINSTYQDYFESRYKPMIDMIQYHGADIVREEGIGIGSISKALRKRDVLCYGFDNSPEMVQLARRNTNGNVLIYQDCILNPETLVSLYPNELVVTHGVLEHFSDENITAIAARYRATGVKSMHYVPTNRYEKPSFGDERLLDPMHWIELLKPEAYQLFNDGHDLVLYLN